METFFKEYVKQLEIAVKTHPEEYRYSVENVPVVAAKMKEAFARRSFNKDGRAIKQTCEALNIPYTYKAIYHFFDNHV